MPRGTLPVVEHLRLRINPGRPGTNLLQLATSSEITSPGFLMADIYHMMFCALGKSFMASFLEMHLSPKTICKHNKWVDLQICSAASGSFSGFSLAEISGCY